MKRRSFLTCAGLAGLSVAIPLSSRRAGAAPEGGYGGPYFIQIEASGGWDPRFFFDPTLDTAQNRLYGSIASVGALRAAELPVDLDALDLGDVPGAEGYQVTPARFLERHGARLTVINGLDMKTNNHDAGVRAAWSGRLEEGYPCLGALVAAALAPEQPMAFLSAGGFDATSGIVPLTRVSSADGMRRLAFPNQMDPSDAETELFHSESTYALIRQLQAERLQALAGRSGLPRVERSVAELVLARQNDRRLSDLVLPDELVETPYYGGDVQRAMQQAQIGLAAFQSGLAASLSLSLGGFDTHGNHDRDQAARLIELFTLIDFVLAQIEALGLRDRVYVLVGSDFARGPFYNGDEDYDGKDHWSIGSFLALGPTVPGDRVIGATTPDQLPLGVDPATLATVESGGTTLRAEHVQHALRRLAGVEEFAAARFPLAGEGLPLFG
jgi:hypothetical protein